MTQKPSNYKVKTRNPRVKIDCIQNDLDSLD